MRILLLILLMIGFASVPTYAAEEYEAGVQKSALYLSLDKAWKEGGIASIKQIVNGASVKTPDEMEALALWLRDNYVMTQKRNPRLGLLYADTLLAIARPYQDEAKAEEYKTVMTTGALAFYSSQLIAFQDIARCADKGAGKQYSANWMRGETAQAYDVFRSTMQDDPKIDLWMRANIIAEERDTTVPDKYACQSSGNVDAVRLISDAQWAPLRTKVNEAVKAKFFKVATK